MRSYASAIFIRRTNSRIARIRCPIGLRASRTNRKRPATLGSLCLNQDAHPRRCTLKGAIDLDFIDAESQATAHRARLGTNMSRGAFGSCFRSDPDRKPHCLRGPSNCTSNEVDGSRRGIRLWPHRRRYRDDHVTLAPSPYLNVQQRRLTHRRRV